MVLDQDGEAVHAPTKLRWNEQSQSWDNGTSFFSPTLSLQFIQGGGRDQCTVRFGSGLTRQVFGSCLGHSRYLQSWCGVGKQNC